MPVIELKKPNCTKCGSGKRMIDIIQFRKDMFIIAESTIVIWNGKKKCWICKRQPQLNEHWGLSINIGERNRLYCPRCAEYVEKQLALTE